MMSGPVERYDAIQAANKFVFLVYYRGNWCPFCQKYLRDLQALSDRIASAGGHVVAVTAQAEFELSTTRASSGYTGETIVDPENLLAKELKRRGLVEVAISQKQGYPHGMAQPAVLVGSPAMGRVLYSWAIVPGAMNLGGAKDRPVLGQVWDNVEAKINGKPEVHARLGSISFMAVVKQKILG